MKSTKTVGLIKFTSREDFDECAPKIAKWVKDGLKLPMECDQVLILGNVSGAEILEIRFLKYETDKDASVVTGLDDQERVCTGSEVGKQVPPADAEVGP